MAEEPVSPSKDDLEHEKLRLEIAELKRPLWRRASTLTAFLPSLTVAILGTLLGVGVGWRTGFFDNQRLVLEAQRHNLESQTRELKLEERGLLGKRAELLGQVGQLEATLSEERGKARAERERDRAEREKLLALRRDEKAKAGTEITALRRNVDEHRDAARRATAIVWLDLLVSGAAPGPGARAPDADELVKALRKESSLVPFVAAEYEKHSANAGLAPKLLIVLHQATGDIRWLDKIADKLSQAALQYEYRAPGTPRSESSVEPPLQVETGHYWKEVARMPILRQQDLPFLERLVTIVTRGTFTHGVRVHHELGGGIVLDMATSFKGSLEQNAFNSDGKYFEFLELSRDYLLLRRRIHHGAINMTDTFTRQKGMDLLARLNPEGAIVVTMVLLAEASDEMKAKGGALPPHLRMILGGSGRPIPNEQKERGRSEFERLGVIGAQVSDWMREHADLVAEWTEPDLARLRQRLSRKAP